MNSKTPEYKFILIFAPVPGMGYGSPSVARVPDRIARKFLEHNSAIEIEEREFQKLKRLYGSRDEFYDEIMKKLEGEIPKHQFDKLVSSRSQTL